MELDIRKLDEVWTADGQRLGLAHHLYHRPDGVNPAVGDYGSYLDIANFEFGDDYYVPTDFIAGRDAQTGRVTLSVTFRQIMERTWNRMPFFIVRGGRQETLPPRS